MKKFEKIFKFNSTKSIFKNQNQIKNQSIQLLRPFFLQANKLNVFFRHFLQRKFGWLSKKKIERKKLTRKISTFFRRKNFC